MLKKDKNSENRRNFEAKQIPIFTQNRVFQHPDRYIPGPDYIHLRIARATKKNENTLTGCPHTGRRSFRVTHIVYRGEVNQPAKNRICGNSIQNFQRLFSAPLRLSHSVCVPAKMQRMKPASFSSSASKYRGKTHCIIFPFQAHQLSMAGTQAHTARRQPMIGPGLQVSRHPHLRAADEQRYRFSYTLL